VQPETIGVKSKRRLKYTSAVLLYSTQLYLSWWTIFYRLASMLVLIN